MRFAIGKAVILGAVVLSAASVMATGCSSRSNPGTSEPSSDGTVGEVGLQLQVGAFTVNQVTYTLTNGTTTLTNTVDVSGASTLSFVIPNVPAGANYVLTLSATATDGTGCRGTSAPFSVAARATTVVGIELACIANRDAGSVLVNGTTNACPAIASVAANPPVGSTIQITSSASDSDNKPAPLTYSWTTSSGTLSNATVANPVLTCSAAGGLVTLQLTVSDGDTAPGCADSFSLIVSCPVGGGTTGGGVTTGATTGGITTGATTGGVTTGATTGGITTGATTGGVTTGATTGGITTGATTGGITTGATTGGVTTGATTGGVTTGATTGGTTGGTTSSANACFTTPNATATNTACTTCEGDCPASPSCESFGAQAGLCNAVLHCARRTNCADISVNDCLCGTGDVGACAAGQAAGLLGPCLTDIRAGLPGVADSALLGSLLDQTTPGGAAMFLTFCDSQVCHDSCFPFCAPGTVPTQR